MNLNECFKRGIIRKVKADENLIRALIGMSFLKENEVKKAKIDKVNIPVYFSLAYDSLREILEAVCVFYEYKVSNHLCMGELLRSLFKDFDYILFDRVRYARNGINYYGSKIGYEEGKILIERMLKMKNEMIKKHLHKFVD